jgi:hypothetical protein
MISLDAVVLPADLWWVDETDWTPVEQNTEYSLAGALIVESSTRQAGRPITLAGHEQRAWVRRSTVLALQAMAVVAGKEMVLTLHARSFNVMFRYDDGLPVEAESRRKKSPPADDDWYTLTLRLMEI